MDDLNFNDPIPEPGSPHDVDVGTATAPTITASSNVKPDVSVAEAVNTAEDMTTIIDATKEEPSTSSTVFPYFFKISVV